LSDLGAPKSHQKGRISRKSVVGKSLDGNAGYTIQLAVHLDVSGGYLNPAMQPYSLMPWDVLTTPAGDSMATLTGFEPASLD
jgi:hypothetical protein